MATRTRKTSARATAKPKSTKGNKTIGRLALAALLSWLAYIGADHLTVAPDGLALWVSGAAAALTLTVRAGRR